MRRVIGRNNQKNKIAAFQVRSHDFARSELLDIQRIVAENEQTLRKAWDDACDRFQLMSAWDGFMPRRPKGLRGSAQGFNPGNHPTKTGRPERAKDRLGQSHAYCSPKKGKRRPVWQSSKLLSARRYRLNRKWSPRNTRKDAKKLRGSHQGHEGHRGNIYVVRTPSAPNFSLSLKINLCDLRDLCVSQFPRGQWRAIRLLHSICVLLRRST